MNRISRPIFVFGLITTLVGIPAFFAGGATECGWLLLTGFFVAAAGLFAVCFGVFLKLASLLFRA